MLPPVPPGPAPRGLWAGVLDADPRAGRRGRTRRWSYAAAGEPGLAVGAAVVDLGFASTSFAWALVDDRLLTWEARGLPLVSARVGDHAATSSRFHARSARVVIGVDGALDLDVPVDGGRLRATSTVVPGTPAVCVTPTPRGGWNATQKAAGERADLVVATPTGERRATAAGTWRDWTLGAQDRHTTWRWAAGAGTTADGHRVGLNLSTGMNGVVGEDVVWWDDQPHGLTVDTLAPVDGDARGAWRVAGPGWALDFASTAVREADEDLWLVRSRYVQPVGVFDGTLPGPDGAPVAVRLVGVTEDHEATW